MFARPITALLSAPAFIVACAQGGTLPPDGAPDAITSIDAPPGIIDARPGTIDATPGMVDAAQGNAAYLDRCTAPIDCQSNLCETDVGGTNFCSRSCASDAACAFEHFCVNNVCQPDDTGAPCVQATADTCGKGLCIVSGDGVGACTRECTSASECPAGYACTIAGGSPTKICVNIERSCATANNCGTGICITGSPPTGCTSSCQSAADCPARLTSVGLVPYTCAIALGSSVPICVPPADILGGDPIGATCNLAGTVTCRSGVCADPNLGLPAMCTQSCAVQGGCGPGLGCFPFANAGEFLLVCNRAGANDLTETCTAAVDCHSGLCDGTGVCSRFCNDGLCPTGWSCVPVAGTSFSICRP